MVDTVQHLLLLGAGLFTLALGIAHFFLPALLDFRTVILEHVPGWKPPRPFRLWPSRYIVTPSDRNGVVWVMNHAASYALVSIGLVDLFAAPWLRGTQPGTLLAIWIGGWWLVRAASQFYFGRRPGDWLILAWFAALGALHLWLAFS